MKCDIVICGVGGQGAILASDILGRAAVMENLDIRAAETHGMAQRGGSVENHVRIGSCNGSLITSKTADILMAFEPAEALRYKYLLKGGGIIIMNTNKILPTTVTVGKFSYPDPEEIIELLKKEYTVYAFNATEEAKKAGSYQAMNIVMIGAASEFIPLSEETLKECIKKLVPQKTIETNMKAFELGKRQIEEKNKQN